MKSDLYKIPAPSWSDFFPLLQSTPSRSFIFAFYTAFGNNYHQLHLQWVVTADSGAVNIPTPAIFQKHAYNFFLFFKAGRMAHWPSERRQRLIRTIVLSPATVIYKPRLLSRWNSPNVSLPSFYYGWFLAVFCLNTHKDLKFGPAEELDVRSINQEKQKEITISMLNKWLICSLA